VAGTALEIAGATAHPRLPPLRGLALLRGRRGQRVLIVGANGEKSHWDLLSLLLSGKDSPLLLFFFWWIRIVGTNIAQPHQASPFSYSHSQRAR